MSNFWFYFMKNIACTRTMYPLLHSALKVSFWFFVLLKKLKINSISEIKFNIENRKRRNWQFSVAIELEIKMILSVHGLKCKCKFHNFFFQFEKGNQNWKPFAALFGKKKIVS